MADIRTQVGRRIRTLRRKRGWRQIDLAAHAEITSTYLSRVERGTKELCLLTLERIAVALDVSPAELLRRR